MTHVPTMRLLAAFAGAALVSIAACSTPGAAAPAAQARPAPTALPPPPAPPPPPPRTPEAEPVPREKVVILDHTFRLELAADPISRAKGLSGRDEIATDGGMMFVYPRPRVLSYWMKDCAVDIDIAFVDPKGRVTATYTMPAERPRDKRESVASYEARLRHYSSRRPAQFALEFHAGTIRTIGLKVGDVVPLEVQRLRAKAR